MSRWMPPREMCGSLVVRYRSSRSLVSVSSIVTTVGSGAASPVESSLSTSLSQVADNPRPDTSQSRK
jgi:hypothetical protein